VQRMGKYNGHAAARPQHHHSLSGRRGLQGGHEGHHPRRAGTGSDHARQRGDPHQCGRLHQGDRSGQGGVWRDRLFGSHPQPDHDHTALHHRRNGSRSGAVQPRQDQGAAARKHRRRGDRLGPDREVGGDPGHQPVGFDAARDGAAGQRRARAQGHGHAVGRAEAVDDPRSRGAAGIRQARRRGAGDAGRSQRRIDPPRHRVAGRPATADDVSAG
jgi:hypothetical protein